MGSQQKGEQIIESRDSIISPHRLMVPQRCQTIRQRRNFEDGLVIKAEIRVLSMHSLNHRLWKYEVDVCFVARGKRPHRGRLELQRIVIYLG